MMKLSIFHSRFKVYEIGGTGRQTIHQVKNVCGIFKEDEDLAGCNNGEGGEEE